MINHTVFFKLKFVHGSIEEKNFFATAAVLATIPGVQDFKRLREISPKNHFDFGFAMKFADKSDYGQYNRHPLHIQFVNQHWVSDVIDFIEIDYEEMA